MSGLAERQHRAWLLETCICLRKFRGAGGTPALGLRSFCFHGMPPRRDGVAPLPAAPARLLQPPRARHAAAQQRIRSAVATAARRGQTRGSVAVLRVRSVLRSGLRSEGEGGRRRGRRHFRGRECSSRRSSSSSSSRLSAGLLVRGARVGPGQRAASSPGGARRRRATWRSSRGTGWSSPHGRCLRADASQPERGAAAACEEPWLALRAVAPHTGTRNAAQSPTLPAPRGGSARALPWRCARRRLRSSSRVSLSCTWLTQARKRAPDLRERARGAQQMLRVEWGRRRARSHRAGAGREPGTPAAAARLANNCRSHEAGGEELHGPAVREHDKVVVGPDRGPGPEAGGHHLEPRGSMVLRSTTSASAPFRAGGSGAALPARALEERDPGSRARLARHTEPPAGTASGHGIPHVAHRVS